MANPVGTTSTGGLGDGAGSALAGVILGHNGEPQPGVLALLHRDSRLEAETHTDAEGRFRFADLPLGVYRLTVPGITLAGIVLDGVAARQVRLKLGPTAGFTYVPSTPRLLPEDENGGRQILYGIVTDASGDGLNGVKLEMRWANAAPDAEFPIEVTGRKPEQPDGFYEFVTTPGVFSLAVVQGDWPSGIADGLDTRSPQGQERISYEVNFQLRAASRPASVDGTMPGERTGRQVTLVRLDAGDDTRTSVLDDDQRFAFRDLPPGSYQLAAEGIGVLTDAFTLASGGLFKLVFPVQSTVTGQAIGARAGTVAVLFAPPPWRWTRQAPLDDDGRFAFRQLPGGQFRLTIGDSSTTVDLTGENALTPPTIDLTQGRRSVLHGKVIDRSGQPQAGVAISLLLGIEVIAHTETLTDGAYRFANLPAGAYSLQAEGMGEVLHELALDGNAERTFNLLWLLGTIHGRLLGADGKLQANRIVRLLQDAEELARAVTGEDGAFRFRALQAGVYGLSLEEGAPLASNVELEEGITLQRDLELPSEKPIAHYLLLPAAGEGRRSSNTTARLALALVLPYLRRTGATGGFTVDEAMHAAQVTILGRSLSPDDEERLSGAGCQVKRLPEDMRPLAAALDRLLAENIGEG